MTTTAVLPTQYQQYIHLSRYSRWIDDKQRRETWPETVARYCDYFEQKFPGVFPRAEIEAAILQLDVMPSMRSLMTAGPALEKHQVAGLNCSFLPFDDVRAFDEMVYILMCGTGVGFSVERQEIAKLPVVGATIIDGKATVVEHLEKVPVTIVVDDSKIGWASAYRRLIEHLYAGEIPSWDVSGVRKKGSRLKTFGGRASGPEPLVDLFRFTIEIFRGAVGRKLTSLEVHDIACKIGDIVVVGGVRRSALISLSNLSDDRMRGAKNGQWWETHPHRRLANNSAVYTERPGVEIFLKEWLSLIESKSGERGIFSRASAQKKAAENGRRDSSYSFGTNPCGEILLRPHGFCNLSESVVRDDDDLDTLKRKVRIATIIGTFQATQTDFQYLRPIWKQNADEERLLGVSLTGNMDHPVLSTTSLEARQLLAQLKQVAIDTNAEWAAKLGIPVSAAITTVKPSGTVSQLVNSASGMHARFAEHYIRTVRADKHDPLTQFMVAAGFPSEDCAFKPDTTTIFSFPVRSPTHCVTRNDDTAIEQLEHYLMFKQAWCEHNPSITVYVREHEWLAVGAWVYEHFEDVGGISFLPHSDHVYAQAPYQDCTLEELEALEARMPQVDWSGLSAFEHEDSTIGMQTLACTAAGCEL